MNKLLNRLVNRRKKTLRGSRISSRSISSIQISKMGRLGQSLVIMSR